MGEYYFRAFAANMDGYSYSDQKELSGGGIDTSIVPCNPGFNMLHLEPSWGLPDEEFYDVDPAEQYGLEWSLTATTNSRTVRFEFGSRPLGIFTTCGDSSPGKGYVRIMVDCRPVAAKAKVYIKELTDTSFDVWLCSGEIMDGLNMKVSMR